jgi:hypothetical protein
MGNQFANFPSIGSSRRSKKHGGTLAPCREDLSATRFGLVRRLQSSTRRLVVGVRGFNAKLLKVGIGSMRKAFKAGKRVATDTLSLVELRSDAILGYF